MWSFLHQNWNWKWVIWSINWKLCSTNFIIKINKNYFLNDIHFIYQCYWSDFTKLITSSGFHSIDCCQLGCAIQGTKSATGNDYISKFIII